MTALSPTRTEPSAHSGPMNALTASGRWLRLAIALAFAGVVTGTVAAGMVLALPREIPGVTGTGSSGPMLRPPPLVTAPDAHVIDVPNLRLFDPGELVPPSLSHEHLLPYVLDGDRATAWHTRSYPTATFGEQGPAGLGVLFDLGAPRTVERVAVALRGGGADLSLRAGDDDPPDPDAYRLLDTSRTTSHHVVLRPAQPVTARYWVLWVSELPPTPGHVFQLGVEEVRFLS